MKKIGILGIAITGAFLIGILSTNPDVEAKGGWQGALEVRQVFVDSTTQFLVVNDPDVTRQSVVWFSIDGAEPDDSMSCGAPLVRDGSFKINCSITSLDAGSTINYIVINP